MRRITTTERPHWKQQADEYGFKFHTMYGEPYWDESAYYQFSLAEIEDEIEDPTEEIHQMCLQVVDRVVDDAELLQKFQIPEVYWDLVRNSWLNHEPSLYSRIDLAYSGHGPAKLYENNADTPTGLYETGFWQWLWLEDKISCSALAEHTDQFNSLQEKLIERFECLRQANPDKILHFTCCKDTDEDRGTVQYMEDCAQQSGIQCQFVYVEDIGHGEGNYLTDTQDQVITWMFKLYPWEFMFREEFASLLSDAKVQFLEPYWKSIISNKALLPMLWQMFKNHPNLLPAFFEDQPECHTLKHVVKKPIFAREGSNVSILLDGNTVLKADGPYGDEGFIYQEYHPLPQFADNYTLIGSWLVNDQAAGISIREDTSPITQDLSRCLPHVILD